MPQHVSGSISDPLWFRLATIAEERNRTIAAIFEEACTAYVAMHNPIAEDRQDQVLRLWREGCTDRVIAARLGWTNHAVAARRRRLGLPPHRQPRTVDAHLTGWTPAPGGHTPGVTETASETAKNPREGHPGGTGRGGAM